jgi:hypothetical protein
VETIEPESIERQVPPTSTVTSRPVATTPDNDKSQFVAVLERENTFLREQVGVKDKQIAELSEHRGPPFHRAKGSPQWAQMAAGRFLT